MLWNILQIHVLVAVVHCQHLFVITVTITPIIITMRVLFGVMKPEMLVVNSGVYHVEWVIIQTTVMINLQEFSMIILSNIPVVIMNIEHAED